MLIHPAGTYYPNLTNIEKEKEIVDLIKNVRTALSLIKPNYSEFSLTHILELVQDGKADLQRIDYPDSEINIYDRIDLSLARKLVKNYKKKSVGCRSCKYRGKKEFDSGLKGYYCTLSESKLKIPKEGIINRREWRLSPRIEKFNETGCGRRDSPFKKTIEEMLAEVS